MYAQKCSHKQTDIDKVLETYIDAIIQGIRDSIEKTTDSVQIKQEKLTQLTNISNIFKHTISALKSMNFKLDKNSVIPIIHGYITQCVHAELKKK